MAKQSITKEEALAFFDNWTPAIRKQAQAHLTRLKAKGFYSHGDYVSVVDANDKVVMYLNSSRLQWRKEEHAPEGAEHAAGLYFEPTGAERVTKAKAEGDKPKTKVTVKKTKPTAADVDAALADA